VFCKRVQSRFSSWFVDWSNSLNSLVLSFLFAICSAFILRRFNVIMNPTRLTQHGKIDALTDSYVTRSAYLSTSDHLSKLLTSASPSIITPDSYSVSGGMYWKVPLNGVLLFCDDDTLRSKSMRKNSGSVCRLSTMIFSGDKLATAWFGTRRTKPHAVGGCGAAHLNVSNPCIDLGFSIKVYNSHRFRFSSYPNAVQSSRLSHRVRQFSRLWS
jgi:hypothetical protein